MQTCNDSQHCLTFRTKNPDERAWSSLSAAVASPSSAASYASAWTDPAARRSARGRRSRPAGQGGSLGGAYLVDP